MRIRETKKCREVGRVFTSGKLRGKLRWNEKTLPEGRGNRTEYSYDENGCLVYSRRTDLKSKKVAESWTEPNGRVLKSRSNMDDKTVLEYIYATNGVRVAVVRVHDGKIVSQSVENAEDFVKWHNDRKKGIESTMPKAEGAHRLLAKSNIPVIDVSQGKLGLWHESCK